MGLFRVANALLLTAVRTTTRLNKLILPYTGLQSLFLLYNPLDSAIPCSRWCFCTGFSMAALPENHAFCFLALPIYLLFLRQMPKRSDRQ